MTFLFRHPFRLIKRLLSFGAYLIQTVWKFLCLRRHGPLSHRARSAWLHESAQQLAEKLRLRVQVSGRIPDHGLITSNHLSYLDIVAIASVAPSIFVSKNEVRYWPVIGLLSTWAGTLYLKRQRRADVGRVSQQIAIHLADRRRVVVFPEGTSSDGSQILPFHSSLFSPAVDTKSIVTPCYLSYSEPGNDPAHRVCYWGSMLFFTHFLQLLTLESIQATLCFGENLPAAECGDRKRLSTLAQKQVVTLKRMAESRPKETSSQK